MFFLPLRPSHSFIFFCYFIVMHKISFQPHRPAETRVYPHSLQSGGSEGTLQHFGNFNRKPRMEINVCLMSC